MLTLNIKAAQKIVDNLNRIARGGEEYWFEFEGTKIPVTEIEKKETETDIVIILYGRWEGCPVGDYSAMLIVQPLGLTKPVRFYVRMKGDWVTFSYRISANKEILEGEL